MLVGDKPYDADQVEQALGVEVVHVLPVDARAATAANLGGDDRFLRRSGLARSCARLGEVVQQRVWDQMTGSDEIAALIEKPVSEVRRMLKLSERVDSIDAVREAGDRSPLEMIPDENSPDPAAQVQRSDLFTKLEQLLGDLSDKHQEVLSRRSGLRGH